MNNEPRLDPKYIVKINGKDFVLYDGLLGLAHQVGIKQLTVKMLTPPTSENEFTAIFEATAITKEGKIFSDIGDANSKNCDSPHFIRIAATRAKARALRGVLNVKICSYEELRDKSEVIGKVAENNDLLTSLNSVKMFKTLTQWVYTKGREIDRLTSNEKQKIEQAIMQKRNNLDTSQKESENLCGTLLQDMLALSSAQDLHSWRVMNAKVVNLLLTNAQKQIIKENGG